MMYIEECDSSRGKYLLRNSTRFLFPGQISEYSKASHRFGYSAVSAPSWVLLNLTRLKSDRRARHFSVDGHEQGHTCVSTHASCLRVIDASAVCQAVRCVWRYVGIRKPYQLEFMPASIAPCVSFLLLHVQFI